jgi:hypothetical protein
MPFPSHPPTRTTSSYIYKLAFKSHTQEKLKLLVSYCPYTSAFRSHMLLLCIYKQKIPLIKMNNFLKFVTVIRVNTVHWILPFYSKFKCSHFHVGIADHREKRNAKTERFTVAWQLQQSPCIILIIKILILKVLYLGQLMRCGHKIIILEKKIRSIVKKNFDKQTLWEII